MDLPILWLIIILVFLILLSAFFSSSETSMIASNRYRLQNSAKTNKNAKKTLKLLENIDSLIGTILLGNNFVNILAASITTILAIKLFGESSIGIASIVLTFVILVFAENTPKTLAARYPEKIAVFFTPLLQVFIIVLRPLVWIIRQITNLFLFIFNIKEKNNHIVSADELKMSVVDAKPNISDKYHKILLNIIDLQDVHIEDIMIPKTEFISIDIDEFDNLENIIAQTSHTRLIVYKEHKENIIGILHMRKVANLYAKGEFNTEKLKEIMVDPYFVPEGISLATQLEEFQKNKKRLALVVDEYGEAKGMIVLEDILEEIVGQFTSNTSEKVAEIEKIDDNNYQIDPSINLYKLEVILNTKFKTNAKTLNGLILENLQELPKRDVSIKIDNVIIEIKQISNEVIKLVHLTHLTTEGNADE
jgi:Mg2+/Co2+ transporter CorB